MALGPPVSRLGETALSRQSTVIENPTVVASPGRAGSACTRSTLFIRAQAAIVAP